MQSWGPLECFAVQAAGKGTLIEHNLQELRIISIKTFLKYK